MNTPTNKVYALWILFDNKFFLFNTYQEEPYYEAKEQCEKHKDGLERQGYTCTITEIPRPN